MRNINHAPFDSSPTQDQDDWLEDEGQRQVEEKVLGDLRREHKRWKADVAPALESVATHENAQRKILEAQLKAAQERLAEAKKEAARRASEPPEVQADRKHVDDAMRKMTQNYEEQIRVKKEELQARKDAKALEKIYLDEDAYPNESKVTRHDILTGNKPLSARLRPESGWNRFKRGFSDLFSRSEPKIRVEAPKTKAPKKEEVRFEQDIRSEGITSARMKPRSEEKRPGFFARLFSPRQQKPQYAESLERYDRRPDYRNQTDLARLKAYQEPSAVAARKEKKSTPHSELKDLPDSAIEELDDSKAA